MGNAFTGCAPQWGCSCFPRRYLIYRTRHGSAADLWALSEQTKIFRRAQAPFRLTNGPLYHSGACPSRDGKQIFALATKRRGELVHYDIKSHQFFTFLSGISAIDPTFSRDGKWVAYTSYPDHTLWRSRSDGTERMQLTYPPMEVAYPFISPDGMRVSFSTSGELCVINMDGGLPHRIIEKNSIAVTWSPDGTRGSAPPLRRPPDRNNHEPERPSPSGGSGRREYPSQCRSGWLPGFYPRHWQLGNLRAECPVALRCCAASPRMSSFSGKNGR